MASLFKKKRKGGGYLYYISVFQNGRTRTIATRTGDLKLAQEIKRKVEDDQVRIEQGLKPAPKLVPILLSEFIPRYLERRRRDRRAKNTLAADRFALQHFQQFSGDLALAAITPKIVRDFREARLKQVKITSVNLALRHLKSAFAWAVDGSEVKYLAENPFKQRGLMLRDDEEKGLTCLTPSEKTALFEAIDRPEYQRLFKFLLLTGCRRNEALNLTWLDIDLEHHQITFHKTKSRHNRIVPISLELMQIINALDRSLPRPFPFQPEHTTHLFKKYVRKAGLREEIHLHSLRHTAASDLVRAGIHPMQIQKLLGHSSLEITQIYTHILPEDLRDAAEKLTCTG